LIYDTVCDAVVAIRNTTDVTDPVRLCKELGIILLPKPLGTEPTAIKGFFYMNRRIKSITVNSDLPKVIQRIIIAHEIGHAVLHASCGINEFHDIGLYDESSIMEKEANLFAAELMLRDEDVLEAMNGDTTFSAAAAELLVPMELLDFKFRVMKAKGYKFVEGPMDVHNNFLKDLEVPVNADYQ